MPNHACTIGTYEGVVAVRRCGSDRERGAYIDGMTPPDDASRSLRDRADRSLGCLIWKPLGLLLVVFAVASAGLALRIAREAEGVERLAGVALAVVVAVVLGVGAWKVVRRKRFSEGDFDV